MTPTREIEAENNRLEAKFKDVTNTDIIRELLRRGRLKQANYSVVYDPKKIDDDGYLDSVRAQAMRGLAIGLLPVVHEKRVSRPPEAGGPRSVLTLDVIVLVPFVAAAAKES